MKNPNDNLSKYQSILAKSYTNKHAKSTAAGYRSCLNKVCTYLRENHYFEKLEYSDIIEMITTWQEEYTNKTISNRLIVLRDLLDMAHKCKVLDEDLASMVKGLKPDTTKDKQIVLSESDFEVMEKTPTNQPSAKNLALFGKQTGLRIQELISLCWSDINFAGKELAVSRVCTLGDFKLPKTLHSIRTIPLSEAAIELLLEQYSITGAIKPVEIMVRDQSKTPTIEHSFRPVFIDDNSGAHFKDSKDYAQRFFTKFLASAGLKHRGPGQLRHSFASIAVSNGMSVKHISHIMGHADTSVTEKHYAHLFPSCNDDIREVLNKSLSPTTESRTPTVEESEVQRDNYLKSDHSEYLPTSIFGHLLIALKLIGLIPNKAPKHTFTFKY
ncbi:tyrosine-type recombinase/integrase [Vibrio astriarenae]